MRDFLTGLQRNLFSTQGCSVISVNYLELNEALLMKSADAFKTAQGHLGWGPLSDLNHKVSKCPLNNMCFNPPTWQISMHQRQGCWLCMGTKIQSMLLGREQGRKIVSSKALDQMRAEEITRDKCMNASCQRRVAAVTANANVRCLSKNTEE